MSKKTSIIMQTYIKNPLTAHMTMASLGCIRMFTDQPYEIIVVDNEPEYPIRDPYSVYKIDKYFKNDTDMGCYASYNFAASKADGDYLVFIQNDVFVHEGWLKWLEFYNQEMGYDVVFPDQSPRTREYTLETYKIDPTLKEARVGWRDAGCMFITREAFDKVGGWPEGAKTAILSEKFMYDRFGKANLQWTDSRKSIITHIRAGTNLQLLHNDPDTYDKMTRKEEQIKA